MNKKVTILGTGVVGTTLANGFKNLGYEVSMANRRGNSVENWNGIISTYTQGIVDADIIILAVKGTAAEEVITMIKNDIENKTVIDVTNPIASSDVKNGVFEYFTNMNESLMERLQAIAPKTNFVKAFNSVGQAVMINPSFNDTKPSMFICGDNQESKEQVKVILDQFGWEPVDMGSSKSARPIEALCMLWCIPGFLENDWYHAVKYIKKS